MKNTRESREWAFIELMRAQLETQLQWGPVTQWTQRDFQNLSDLMEEKTGQHIGITTLKRLLGRVDHKGLPYLNTLNVIAHFLGHAHWLDFKKENGRHFSDPPVSEADLPETQDALVELYPPEPSLRVSAIHVNRNVILPWTLVGLLALGMIFQFLRPAPAELSGRKTYTTGVINSDDAISDTFPHVVHFNYFLPNLDSNNLNVITFEPGILKYFHVDRQGLGSQQYLYTRPGFFNVKVFSNKTQLARKSVLISSGGWKGLLQNREKREFPLQVIRQNGILKFDKEDLQRIVHDTTRRFFCSTYFYKDFGLDGDNFTLKARLRNSSSPNLNLEHSVFFRFWCENDYHMVHLSSVIRQQEIFNRYGNIVLDSGSTPLNVFKKFLHDTQNWFDLEVQVRNRNVRLFFNRELYFDTTYSTPIGNLMGLEANFLGTGEIDYIHLTDAEGSPVLREEF